MVAASIGDLGRPSTQVSLPLAVLHPHRKGDLEVIRVSVLDNRVDSLFVMPWSPAGYDAVTLLQAPGSTNLATRRRTPLLADAQMWAAAGVAAGPRGSLRAPHASFLAGRDTCVRLTPRRSGSRAVGGAEGVCAGAGFRPRSLAGSA